MDFAKIKSNADLSRNFNEKAFRLKETFYSVQNPNQVLPTMSMRKSLISSYIFLWTGIFSQTVNAGEISTVVKYISGSSVYADAGSAAGIQSGDTAQVISKDQVTARLIVAFVAENSASCNIVWQEKTPQVGDKVVVFVTDQSENEIESAVSAPATPAAAPVPSPVSAPSKKSARVSGKIGLQYYGELSRSSENTSFQEPSLLVNVRFADVLAPGYDVAVNLRARRLLTDGTQSSPSAEWNNRIYEVSLNYYRPETNLSYQLGRVQSNQIAGMGLIDGAIADYRLNDRVTSGFFAGMEPDYRNSQIRPESTKAGIYTSYKSGDILTSQLSLTGAAAGSYVNGIIDREFLYQQVSYTYRSKIFLYQSSEIGFNRDWRKQAAGSTLELSNLILNLQYRISRIFTLSAGYDNRINEHTYYNRSTPDSLFDDALRQGFRLGGNVLLPLGFRAGLLSSLRTQDGQTDSRFYSAFLNQANLFNRQIFAGLNYSAFDNPYSQGTQYSLMLSHNVLRNVNLGVSVGRNNLHYQVYNIDAVSDWMKFNANAFFTRSFYSSLSLEIYRGDDYDAERVFVDFGVRL